MTDTPSPALLDDDLDFDLDSIAAQRREGGRRPMRFRWRNEVMELPSELPLDVLAPLKGQASSLSLVFAEAIGAGTSGGGRDSTEIILSVIASKPDLPSELVDAVTEMGRRLFNSEEHPEQWERFIAGRPSTDDAVALGRKLFDRYGVTLGEASPSSGSSPAGGRTSSATSGASTTASTPEGSSPDQAPPAS